MKRWVFIMSLVIGCFAWLLMSEAHAMPPQREQPFIVAGYLPDYRFDEWSRDAGPLTDLVYFGMPAPKDGKFDSNAISQKRLVEIKAIRTKARCRVLLTIGGWGKSDGFVPLVADETQRRQFVRDALAYCLEHEIDGIDYDWEHPDGAKQVAGLVTLLQETKAAFKPHGRIVVLTVAGWQDLGKAAYEAVDRVHLMAYDHDHPHATFDKTTTDVERLVKDGCPKGKIVLGVPFYGRNQAKEARSYAELIRARDVADDVDMLDGYAFNGPATIRRKVDDALEKGLAGVMIWELGQDAAGDRSLLKVIGRRVEESREKSR